MKFQTQQKILVQFCATQYLNDKFISKNTALKTKQNVCSVCVECFPSVQKKTSCQKIFQLFELNFLKPIFWPTVPQRRPSDAVQGR